MADGSAMYVPVLSPAKWGEYVRDESRMFIDAVSAELALRGVPVDRTQRDATIQRVSLLAQEVHAALIEFGVRPEVATISLRQITSAAQPDARLAMLEECVAYVRYLPSRGDIAISKVRASLHGAPEVAS